MAKSTCENNVTISGLQEDLDKLSAWVTAQTHEQAPNAQWAALYNLEQIAKDLPSIDGVYEGSPDHAYGPVMFKEMRNTDGDQGRILYNFASKSDSCLLVVQALAVKYPSLQFDVGFSNFDTGEGGSALFRNGTLDSIEIEEAESSFDYDSEDESDW